MNEGYRFIFNDHIIATTYDSRIQCMTIMRIKADDVSMRRPNIVYSVVAYEKDEFRRGNIAVVCRLVGEKLKEYPAPAMIIVYSSSITTTHEVSSALDWGLTSQMFVLCFMSGPFISCGVMSRRVVRPGGMGSGVTMRWMGGLIEYGVRRERSVMMCVERVIP